nr:hypothetical protein [uncultured Roseovarius sp.]
MMFSLEMELALVTLNELDDLAAALQRRLNSTPQERSESFENYLVVKSALTGEDQLSAPSVSERVSHVRFLKMKDRQRKRVARRMMFASGFSAMERFLLLRTPNCKPKSNFPTLGERLQETLGPREWENPNIAERWGKLNYYRAARNKILHQCALITEPGSDCDERALLAENLSPVFLEEVEGRAGLKEIAIKESFLGDYFCFLKDFAMDVNKKISGLPSC